MTQQKILIVDDEPFNIDYLAQELEDDDLLIIPAVNGQDALDKVAAESPDLILLDIMMPVMDGFEVLAHLKADAATSDIPVVIISAANDLSNMVRGIQLGAEDYLPKPFEPVLLHARIYSSLEKKRLRDLQKLYLRSLEREFEIAREIQQGFLPAELPEAPGWKIAALFKAAKEVAGDFYDAFLLPDGNLACIVGDVCGKGVGAALFMTLFRSLIRATATSDLSCSGMDVSSLSPAERLKHVVSFTNEYVADTHADADMFATLFAGIFNVQDGTLTYINAGNEPLHVVRNGQSIAALRPTGPVIGVLPGAVYNVKEIRLEEHDTLLAFTDGIPDTLNEENTAYGNDRLLDLVKNADPTPEMMVQTIEDSLTRFIGKAQQFDDITLIAVQRQTS